MLDKVRIDKWLWSVRIFKSRSMATTACKSGKVKIEDKSVKPSYLVSREEIIKVSKNGFNLQFRVIDLIEKRVGAPIAVLNYEDITPEEELNKYKDWFIGKAAAERRSKGSGRPTKRERRIIDDFKGNLYDEFD